MKTIITWLKRAAMLSVTVAFAAAGFGANAATSLTLNDGDTLTGVYEDYEITIAAGATVTFNNATVTRASDNAAVVQTLGDATIILAEGSENSVAHTQMSGYAGAGISPAVNYTLTIDGSGSLTVQGGCGSAGIGANSNYGSCGNIVIAGGTIVATGGEGGSGIGAGYYESKCGDITIAGGNVTANVLKTTNSYAPPAIGAGYVRSSCGNILICGGTVTADASDPDDSYDNACAIGASIGTCGAITIVDGVERIVATKGAKAQEIIGKGGSDDTSVGKVSRLLRFNKEYSNNDNTLTLTPGSDFESYTVTWKNDDGTTADTTSVEYGLLPSHAALTKASDGTLEYLFAGWTPEIAEVESNVVYTAVFIAVPAVHSTGGDAEWFVDADEGALRSGVIGDNQNTWLRTSLPRPCVFSFKWKTSSETGCDQLHFMVNGAYVFDTEGRQVATISGVGNDWTTVSVVISNSLDVLEWKYGKDGSAVSGQDCGWVKDFEMAPFDGEIHSLSVVPNYDGLATVTAYAAKDVVMDVFPPLARHGYALLGYFTAAEGGELVAPPYALSADTTLYAHWAKTTDFDTSDPTAEWTIEDDGITWRTGTIGHSTNTWATYTVKRPCTVTYKWKTSTEANNDPLVFYVDDVEQSRISGESADWVDVSLSFEDSKNHVLKWVYSKDWSATGTYDCGWIRDFVVTPYDSWTVTRDLNYEGATELETRYVKKGSQLDVSEFPPLDEPRESYTCYWALAPWSGDALTNAVDISADTTLYAHWIKQHGFDEIDTTCQTPWTWLDDGSIRTGKIGDSTNTWATISVTGPCDVSFKWKSSSENGWDKLHFYVDDSHKIEISGVMTEWESYTVSVGSGDHVLKWSYTKDGSSSVGEDCGWIKDIVITAPDSAPYTVTWQNADGTTLETDADLVAGAVPAYSSALPTQAATAQYYFDFAGWEPDFELVSSNTTYTAKYPATLRSYDVTWQNEDGTPLGATNIFYGATPTYSGATPVKPATPKFTYTFAGWDPEVAEVTGEATYTAKYDATINEYTITWKNDDGTVIDSADVAYDETPTHADPVKASTAQYDYEFAGWDPAVASVTGEAIYTATFTPILRSYTITWLNEDGTTLDTSTVAYGETPTHAAPTKASTAQYDYTFAGWGDVVAVTGEATYQATFTPVLRSYTITWANIDGAGASAASTVEYGTTPTYSGETPTKAETAEYTYTFTGWSPAVDTVTGAATYTAQFNSTKRSYTITWANIDGEGASATSTVEYGTTPTYSGATPTKVETVEYTYTFAGWDKALVAVTGEATYTATFNSTKRSYTITWKNDDGTTIDTTTVEYGIVPVHADATKAETDEYTYEFAGWSPAVVSVTGAATYTAQFNATPKEPEDEFAGYVKIGDVEGFNAIANNLATNYVLTADIDLQNVERQPFGTFSGVLDGNGHAIRNLNIKRNDSKCALFSYLNGATIRNLTLQDGKIEIEGNNSDAAGIAGHVQNGALIEDCTVDGLEIISKNLTAGGFVGYAESGNLIIRRCRSLALITANGSNSAAGGFVGYTDANVQIEDCYYSGVITAGRYAGGIVGQKYYGTIAISNCYHNSCLYPDTNNDGKFVGNGDGNATITGDPIVIDAFPKGGVRVKVSGAGTGTAEYVNSEIVATPAEGSFYAGYIGMIPEGEFNDVTVWAVFGKEIATVGTFNEITNNLAGVYKLTADIDLQNVERQPFGEFSGVLDGNGHVIKNISITKGSDTYIGLFSKLNGATIRNLTLEGGRIEGYDNVGGIAGEILGDTLIENCSVNLEVFGNRYTIGGLVGHAYGGNVTIRRCRSLGDVTSNQGEGGGLVGVTNSDNLRIEDCYAEGTITSRTNSGGAVGLKDRGSLAISNCCHNTTLVPNGDKRYVGNGDDKATISGVPSADADLTSGVPFEGWDTIVWKFTEGLYPRLRAFIPKYTVTWLDEDGETILDEAQFDEFDTPVYGGVTPAKAATAQYTYTFAGWTPAVAAVESNTTYTANYDATLRSYTITWKNDDGSTIDTTTVAYGETPTHADATKAETAEYTYTFAGWSPSVVAVTGAATYTATFDATPKTPEEGGLEQDGDGYYLLGSVQDWRDFAELVETSPTANARMTADINLGADQTHIYGFAGIFDGQGHTLVIHYEGNTYGLTPFHDTTGATIKNLHVDGSIVSTYGRESHLSGVIGRSRGTDTITNVWVSVNMTSAGGGWLECAAFIGCNNSGDSSISDCLFTGSITTTAGSYNGCFLGYSDSGTVTIRNCLSTGTFEYVGGGNSIRGSHANCYVKAFPSAIPAGMQVTAGDLADGTTAAALQAEREATVWVQDAQSGQPVLAMFYTAPEVPDTVTVTWKNEDGTTLETDTVAYGATPVYDGETPTKAADAQYTYEFAGWTPAVAAVTDDTVHTATFTPVTRSYNVTWVVEGTTVASGTVEYGDTPSYDGETPTKASTAEYSYEFTGWTPVIAAVTSNTTYTATFSETKRSYTVSWVVEGETVASGTVEYGTMPTYSGDTPTKESTAQYDYEFAGWGDVVAVTGDATYTAVFTPVTRSYNVTWVVEGMTVETDVGVAYGATPVYDSETPTKAADAQYTYEFTGWSPTVSTVTGDATYTAQFNSTKRSYMVSWFVEGATVASGAVEYGTTPTYDGDTPTKESTAEYSYSFTGWSPAVATVAGDVTYTAQFSQTKRSYMVSWVVEGATVASGTVEYGTTPVYNGATPTKESTAQYDYEFAGWGDVVAVTGDATYTAVFTPVTRSYNVTWVVEGETVASGTVEYGTTPVYNGATPTKPEDENYTYTFNGWTPAIAAVTDDTTYTAQFTATPKETEDPEEPYEGTETIDGVTWSYTVAGGEATINGTYQTVTSLVIPDSVHDGIPVTAIAEGAFADWYELEEVTISRYVRRIGADVGVKSADWAQNLEEAGFDGSYPAFGNCESLMNYRVDANNEVFEEIGGALYYRDTPASAKTLALYPSGRSTLYFADGLTVTKIGDGACAWCHQFTELTIPASVREIGVRSFDSCREIVTLAIPATVTDIGWGAFLMNIALESADINGTDLAIGDYAFYHSFMADNAGNLVIRGGVKDVGFNAFCHSMHLGAVVMEDGVTNIAMNAFSQCYDLSAVTLPDTLTAIGAGAFCGCSELREIIVPLSVEDIGLSQPDDGSEGGAFAGCSALARIYLPLSLKPATAEETNAYLANVFNGLGLEDMSAAEIAEILTWYSDPSEIGGGDEPGEPTELPDYVTTGGNAEWFVDTDGSWRSGTIMNSQETWIETTVTGPCLVTFSWKASSEGGGYDMLALAVDGEEKDSIGGVMSDWVEYSLPIPESGAHTVRWTYSKDGSAWDGEDCGWVKDFTETPKEFATYTVTWKNWDGTVLAEDSVVEGYMPVYRGETPARETDEDYYYDFAGWTPVVASVTGDAIYTATYNEYQARFEMVMDGTTVTGYIGLVPKHITLADWPEGVTAIADDVFSGYSALGFYGLESVEIPATVQTIGQRAFYSSYGLTNLVFEAGGTQPLEIGFAAFSFAYALESVTLPERLASIADSGFYQCDKLAEVTFLGGRENVTIGRSAFSGAPWWNLLPFKMLVDVNGEIYAYEGTVPEIIGLGDWPAGATSIGDLGVFSGSMVLKDLTIPATIAKVGWGSFQSCGSLTNVLFAAAGDSPSPLEIAKNAFANCGELVSVTFREGTAAIGEGAFFEDVKLAEVNFPASGTDGITIDDTAFVSTAYASMMPFRLIMDSYNTVIGYVGSCPATIGASDWPVGAAGMNGDIFAGCASLEHITFPAGMQYIGYRAFADCANLASVNFANCAESLNTIGGFAFAGCTRLETVELAGDNLYVDQYAFQGCTSLTALTLQPGVSWVDSYAFADCTRLEAFVNNSDAVIDETAFLGTAYNRNMPFSWIVSTDDWSGERTIIGNRGVCPAQINAEDWPENIQVINRRSFTFNSDIRAVVFPESLTRIDESAFACCTNLVSITFPTNNLNGGLRVEHNAFALCTKLQNLTLRGALTVNMDAFAGCSSLETVIVEKGVQEIGEGAFARTKLRSIVLPEDMDYVDEAAFASGDNDFTVYIPRNADGGNYGVSGGSVAYEYIPRIFGLETEEGWARYGLVVRATTTNLRVVPYCRVTLDLAGGTGVATSQLGTGETVNDQFPHPVKSGFTFAGWTSARVAAIAADTTWTAIIGSATGMEATLTALWTPNETPEPPEIVVEDQELQDKLDDPVVDEDTGIRTIKPKDDQTTLTQDDADKIDIKSPLDGTTSIKGAYTMRCDPSLNQIVITLAVPEVESVAEEENKEAEDATGLLEDVAKVDDEKIAAMPEPDVSDPDPEKREEVGALPIKMYPGLYYQASWGDDLNNLTSGAKFRADGVRTHIGVIKQNGSRGFYKISVSER